MILEAVKRYKTLEKLNLSSNGSLDSTQIGDIVKDDTTLQELNIAKCNLRDNMKPIMLALAVNQSLQKLSLDYNELHYQDTLDVCEALGKNRILTSINLSGAGFIQSNSGCLCAVVETTPLLELASL